MMNTFVKLGIGILAAGLLVLVGCEGEGGGSEPQNLSLTGADYGQAVLLAWEEPTQGTPNSYLIYFRELAAADFQLVATIDGDSLEYTHSPSDQTGDYYVAAKLGGTEYSSDTITTIPFHSDVLVISELNAPGDQGYGWAITGDFTGATYAMTVTTNDSLIDFYVTNFMNDSTGGPWPTPWCIASPDTAPNDPGGNLVPQAGWRENWFSDRLPNPQAILPNFASTTYFKFMSGIDTDTTYIGVYLGTEQHYGLVKFFGADTIAGTINVEAWFQTVQGLRLVAH
jgi:hypothetical protein